MLINRRSPLLVAVATTVGGAFVTNYLVRVAEAPDRPSHGIVVEYLHTRGPGALLLRLVVVAAILWAGLWLLGLLKGLGTAEIQSFWLLAAQHPDDAYNWFRSSAAWRVFEHSLPPDHADEVPPSEWEGPFHLAVPEIGGRVFIFGRRGEYEATRGKLIAELSRRKA